MLAMLAKNRAKRAQEELEKSKLFAIKFAKEKKVKDEEYAALMAVINAKKALDDAAKEVERKKTAEASAARMNEMTFSFAWGQ